MAASKGSGGARRARRQAVSIPPQWSSRSCSARRTIAGELQDSPDPRRRLARLSRPIPPSAQDLLITPHRDMPAADRRERDSGTVDARATAARDRVPAGHRRGQLSLSSEVLRILVPMTQWWQDRAASRRRSRTTRAARYTEEALRAAVEGLFLSLFETQRSDSNHDQAIHAASTATSPLPALLLWVSTRKSCRPRAGLLTDEEVLRLISSNVKQIVSGLLRLSTGPGRSAIGCRTVWTRMRPKNPPLIFQVSLNRRAAPALATRSRPSRRTPRAACSRSTARASSGRCSTRASTARIRRLHRSMRAPRADHASGRPSTSPTFARSSAATMPTSMTTAGTPAGGVILEPPDKTKLKEARTRLKDIADDAKDGGRSTGTRSKSFIEVDPRTPQPARHPCRRHSRRATAKETDKKSGYSDGMCPDIRLYDFRVLGRTLEDTEFAIIAALQYIRYLNERHSYITIHGANLSLSIPHNVRNYACGRTPDVQRMRAAGGQRRRRGRGRRQSRLSELRDQAKGRIEGYAAFSITDPGNADGVITVGATHRYWPHTYGVSFFSSRGPTGDGRLKPDLVAPGERIRGADAGQRMGPGSRRHQHGRAARQRRGGDADGALLRADRPAAAHQAHPVRERHRPGPRAQLPGPRHARRPARLPERSRRGQP